MNIKKLDPTQKKAVHAEICRGGGLHGAAEAAGVDRRTLARMISDEFLSDLVPGDEITREDYAALTDECYHFGERMADRELRDQYRAVIERKHGDALRDRLESEERRERRLAIEAEEKAERDRRKAEKAKARREERKAAEAERDLERQAAIMGGDWYRELRSVVRAFEYCLGTPEEMDLGLGGAGRSDERDAHRKRSGFIHLSDHSVIPFASYALVRDNASETVRRVLDLVRKYERLGE